MNKLSVGIDIGGTRTKIGIVDAAGNVCANAIIAMSAYPRESDYPAYVDKLCSEIQRLLALQEGDYEVVGIGMGAPMANYNNCTIDNPGNLWTPDNVSDQHNRIFPIAKDILARFESDAKLNGTKIVVTNDANAAAIGEMVYGGAKGMKNFVVVTLGTGVGGGIVLNGGLINGHRGVGGELGHIVVQPEGRQCGCGLRGCIEPYASATGIVRTVTNWLNETDEPSILRSVDPEKIESKDISDAALAGDALAKRAYEYTGDLLGKCLANILPILDPEAIFITGGLAKAGNLILEPTEKAMRASLLRIYGDVKLALSQINDDNAAVRGASALVW